MIEINVDGTLIRFSRSGIFTASGTVQERKANCRIVLLIAFIVIFLTEITSNTAPAAVFLPLVAGFALSIGASPISLMIPVALAASCAFMMPVATLPNAIVFASGAVTIPHMARAGLLLNLAAMFLIVLASYSLVPLVFGTVLTAEG